MPLTEEIDLRDQLVTAERAMMQMGKDFKESEDLRVSGMGDGLLVAVVELRRILGTRV